MIETASGILLVLFVGCVVLPICGMVVFWLSGLFGDRRD